MDLPSSWSAREALNIDTIIFNDDKNRPITVYGGTPCKGERSFSINMERPYGNYAAILSDLNTGIVHSVRYKADPESTTTGMDTDIIHMQDGDPRFKIVCEALYQLRVGGHITGIARDVFHEAEIPSGNDTTSVLLRDGTREKFSPDMDPAEILHSTVPFYPIYFGLNGEVRNDPDGLTQDKISALEANPGLVVDTSSSDTQAVNAVAAPS